MKHVVAILIVAVAVFAVGCQDNSATEPVTNSAHHQLLKPTPTSGVVLLKGDVSPTGIGGEGLVFHVTGQVSYSYSVIGDPADPILDFAFNTQAQLVPSNPILPLGTIDSQSEYQISLASKQGVTYVQRDYYVQSVGAKFHIVFAIDENNSVSVNSMTMDQVPQGQGGLRTN